MALDTPRESDLCTGWRPLSEEHFSAFDVPLIQNGRAVDAALEEIEGPRAALAPLEQLLRSVWKSTSAEAVTRTTSRRWRRAPEI